MSYNSGFSLATSTFAVATTALALSEADRERSRYEGAIETEYKSIARSIAKKAVFQEAATEMLGDIKEIANLKDLDDAKDLKVRPGGFSLFEKDVPDDIEKWATRTARSFMGEFLNRKEASLANQFYSIATHGLWMDPKYSGKVYNETKGIAFLDSLNDDGIRAVARNGVALAFEQYLTKGAKTGFFSGTSEFSRTVKEHTLQEHRALAKAVKHLVDGVNENIEDARRPSYATITHQSPAYINS